MKVFIIGLPGVGKTTFGRIFAESLNIPHYDLDTLIEEQEDSRIASYFQNHGEPAFRVIESECLKKVIHDNDAFVLSTGGGTPAYGENMTLMQSSGVCILLKDGHDVIAERIIQDAEIRPMFKGLNEGEINQKLSQLWSERRSYYEQTHIITGVEAVQNPQLLTKRLELFTKKGNSLIGIIEID